MYARGRWPPHVPTPESGWGLKKKQQKNEDEARRGTQATSSSQAADPSWDLGTAKLQRLQSDKSFSSLNLRNYWFFLFFFPPLGPYGAPPWNFSRAGSRLSGGTLSLAPTPDHSPDFFSFVHQTLSSLAFSTDVSLNLKRWCGNRPILQ